MKHVVDKPSRTLIIVQRFLAGLLILIALAVIAGTLYALIFQSRDASVETVPDQQTALQADNRIFTSKGTFTGIGRIRAKSAEPDAAAVLITIAFPYDPDDISFSEELASKITQFRSETIQYFQSYTTDELRLKADEEIQEEILARYNALLRLGIIDTLYITDYMIID
jgi:flagellar basal body-associated protein FliL